MRDFFEGEPVMDFFTENFKEVIEDLFQYYLSMKKDSSAIQKIYFSMSDSSPDFSRKVLTVFSWLSVHFESETDSSKLFQKIDSSFEGNANMILENGDSFNEFEDRSIVGVTALDKRASRGRVSSSTLNIQSNEPDYSPDILDNGK